MNSYGGSEANGWPSLRWTAPEAGTIDIAATFADGGAGSMVAFVFVKDVLNSVGAADATGISWSSNGVSVEAGDTVEFVTAGAAGAGSVTMLDATITHTVEVPEPGTMALLGIGVLSLIGLSRRRKGS